ncbi:MAG: hypothetical protein ACOCTG_04075 [Bacteroidota bacterium]
MKRTTAIKMHRSTRALWLWGILLLIPAAALAQEGSTIPSQYRGSADAVARGIMDGNMIETNFRNHGELSRWRDHPQGIWPRGVGGRHIDGVAVAVAGLVRGEREKWAGQPYDFWPAGTQDTLLNLISINFRGQNIGTKYGPDGSVWGWLPLSGFHNSLRRNPNTGLRDPTPASSGDRTSWPAFWPDRLDEEDSGWPGQWNGMFGKGVFNADLEAYYVMDDYSYRSYQRNRSTGSPNSQWGLFYPDAADSTKGGLGVQVAVRLLQWANILAEDTMFLIYRITNTGQTDYGECVDIGTGTRPPNALPADLDECARRFGSTSVKTGLYFTQLVDFGLGEEEGDETAAFDPLQDVAYGWDHDGIGSRESGGTYDLGYVGFAFLESPTNDEDGIDNDQDGIVDEERFGGPGMRIVGQDAIRSHVESRYDMSLFSAWYGPLESRPAFRAGVWWTGDDDLDWVGFEDANGNGVWDPGELLQDDYGRDGLGPYDINYPGTDAGEADGVPTVGEPNFDQTDVDESDQMGLTGVHVASRLYYQPGATSNITSDQWLWARIRENQFPAGTDPDAVTLPNQEPFLNFSSGPVNLPGNNTDFFSTAWIVGWDEQDFFDNRRTVQNIYNADYRFAQPPIVPTLKAEAGDGYVVLSWDTLSIASYDRFTQCNDFEGYKLYKGTDELLSDARQITDVRGTPTFYRPVAQWDLENGITGRVPVLNNTALYDLGNDSGLEYSFIDRDVVNGKTYYYALVAYDHATLNPECVRTVEDDGDQLDPQENTFNFRALTPNTAIAVPRARAAGYIGPSANENLNRPTEGIGTGWIEVSVVNSADLKEDVVYRLAFFDSTRAGQDVYQTTGYQLTNVTENEVMIPRSPVTETTPVVDGFVIDIHNQPVGLDMQRTGWMGTEDGEVVFSRNPAAVPGYTTNWSFTIREDTTSRFVAAPYEYELRWTDEPVSTPNRNFAGYLRDQPIPMACHNVTLDRECALFVYDTNDNGEVDPLSDSFIIADIIGFLYRFRYQVDFQAFGQNVPPSPGNVLHVGTRRPFSGEDYFQFTLSPGRVDESLASDELARISVVPNPYVAAAEWEPRPEVLGRGPRRLQFVNLPEQCTISIFTMRGELVRTIEHQGSSGDGAAWWDLMTENNQEVAYGVYFYHVNAPGIGEKTGKFAIIK